MILFDIPETSAISKQMLTEALTTVIDPELNVNIVDLGLVYAVSLDPGARTIEISMTLSSTFCPVGESILLAVKHSLERSFDTFHAEVTLTWDPPWDYSFISPEGIRSLRGE